MGSLSYDMLFAFTLASVLIELTPGPNMAYLALVAASQGRRPGYAAVSGVALGLALIGIAAALGVAALVSASNAAYEGLRWAGVLYLLWLAWDGWRGAGNEAAQFAPLGSSNWRYFRRGLITNLLNPKAAVFYIAVLPTFLAARSDALREVFVLTAIYVFVATAIHLAIVTAAGAAHRFFEDPRRALILGRVLSLALAAVAVWFAVKTAR